MNINVFKLSTDKLFIPEKNYFIINDKKATQITAISTTENGSYFYSEKNMDPFFNGEINGKLSSEDGTIRTNNIKMKPLSYIGFRESERSCF